MGLAASKFSRFVDEVLGDFLSGHGFEPISPKHTVRGTWLRVYRSTERYIRVFAAERSRDGGAHLDVLLGNGPDSWPDVDWNTISLRALAGHRGWYPLEESAAHHLVEESVVTALHAVRNDLEHHAHDFISGDLSRFQHILAAQNERREPYRVLSPNEDGTYTVETDSKSAELKRRYSAASE